MPGFEIFGDEERREVQEVLETGVLFRYGFEHARRGRYKAREFELELSRRLGVEHCLLCSSGTAALCTALAAAEIGAGDEVVVPPFTFVATLEAVILAGAVPVFADIDATLGLDPAAVERAIGPRTRAVLVVHMCGSMARIDRLVEVCDRRGVMLIEDTAQALGATFRGRALGTFGRIGCFSFDAVKTVTCGEGGGIATRERALWERADQYADHGHDHAGANRGLDGHPILGTNYRISELHAAVGLAQLRKLDAMIATQRRHKAALERVLASCPDVTLREIPDPEGDSATFLTFFLADLDRAREAARELERAGVGERIHWFDNNWHYVRRWDHMREFRTADLSRSDAWVGRALSLPIKLSWTPAELERLGAGLASVLGG